MAGTVRVARYFVVGGVAACVDFSLYVILAIGLSIGYLIAGATGFVLATVVNYLLSIRFVFESGVRFSRWSEVSAVFAVSAVGLLIHQIVLYICVEWFDAHLLTAKVVATGLVFLWNYLARARYVFSPPERRLGQE